MSFGTSWCFDGCLRFRNLSSWWISERITRWNSTLTGLRQDRILEEAAATGTRDPMHLASMFGLHPNTAQRYADAVYGRHDDFDHDNGSHFRVTRPPSGRLLRG